MLSEVRANSKKSPPSWVEGPLTGLPGRGIYESLHFLRENWHQPINVNDLRKVSALSPRGFQKAFQRTTGRSPGRELRRIRIERSKELLIGSDDNLEVVARKSGYRSLNTFCIAFKRDTEMSPGRYRAQFRRV